MPSLIRSILLLLVVGILAPRAVARQENPVYVDDSPRAWELFQAARDQSAENEGEAVRLYQELLDEYGEKLIPVNAAAQDQFTSVRPRVLADLVDDVDLLERYRTMQEPEAARLRDSGAHLRLALTRPLTTAGLDALLALGQAALEDARFHAAIGWLEEAAAHPDLRADSAAHCWFMLGLSAHDLGLETERSTAIAQLVALGDDGARCRAELERLIAENARPTIVRGVTPLHSARAAELTDLVAQTIWSVELPDALISRRFPENRIGAGPRPAAPPGFGNAAIIRRPPNQSYERRRREGTMATVAATVAGPVVYVNEGHSVRALDRFTGRSIWPRAFTDRSRPSIEDRDNEAAGDLNVIAVDGDALVTLTGHAYTAARSSDGKVVCLDARTGTPRWVRSLDRIGGEEEYDGLFPHGAPVIGENVVYVLARKETRLMLTGSYLVALELDGGRPLWIRHLASSGGRSRSGRPFSSLVLDGRRLYAATAVGAITSLDAATGMVHWLHRSNVPVRARDLQRRPWEMGGPVLVPSAIGERRLVALSPDQRRVIVYDAENGDELASHDAMTRDRWNGPAYLLHRGPYVFAVGAEIRAFHVDALDRLLWRLPPPETSPADGRAAPAPAPTEPFAIAGRVQVADDLLMVPTLDGLVILDHETGRVERRLAVDAPGNPVADGAQVVLATSDSLDVYMPLTRAEEILRERLARTPDDPEPAMSLIQLGMRVGDLSLALEAGELARRAIDSAPTDAGGMGVRRELFDLLIEIHRRGLTGGSDAEGEALYGLLGAIAQRVEQRVEHLLAWGDWLAAREPARAVEVYQSILSDPVLARAVRPERDVLRPAAIWSARRLDELIREHGRTIYAPQDDYARRSFDRLVETPGASDDDLLALALEFPFAEAGLDAALLAARQRHDRGDERGALAALSSAWQLAPVVDRAGPLLGAFVDATVEAGHTDQAREMLGAIDDGLGNVELATANGSRRARTWLEALEAAVAPRATIGLRPGPARRRPGRMLPVHAEADGATLPPDRVLLLDGVALSLVPAERNEPLWTTDLDDARVQLLHASDARILLWAGSDQTGDRRVVALDARTGRALWTTPPLADVIDEPLARDRGVSSQMQMPDGIPFDPRETMPLVLPSAVVLVQRTGGVAAFDSIDGRVLWALDNTLEQVHLVQSHEFGIALAGLDRRADARGGEVMREPRVLVLDAERGGRTAHRFRPQTTRGVVWMAADPFGTLLCASAEGIEALDLLDGRRRWSNMSFETSETRRGWMGRRHAIVESRTSGVFALRLEDGYASRLFDTSVRGEWDPLSLAQISIDGDLVLARFGRRIIRYDFEGDVLGADIVGDASRDYRFLMRGRDALVVLSLYDSRQMPVANGVRQKQWIYRIYVLSETCKLVGEMIELPPLTERVRDAALVNGHLLLSTDADTVDLPLPVR